MSTHAPFALDANVICHYCDAPATTWDHIVPRSRGGRDGRYNLMESCRPCNETKGNDWPDCECLQCTAAVFRFHNPTRFGPVADRLRRSIADEWPGEQGSWAS